jgi:hypothetical protein
MWFWQYTSVIEFYETDHNQARNLKKGSKPETFIETVHATCMIQNHV